MSARIGLIDDISLSFFLQNIDILNNYKSANTILKNLCGINLFFRDQFEATELLQEIKGRSIQTAEKSRREYGDFQTNLDLSKKIIDYIYSENNEIEFVLEPTCGKGNFIIAALELFPSLKKVVGIEIHMPYIWEAKFKILSFFLKNTTKKKPDIDIHHKSIFDFSFSNLIKETKKLKTLIIGNPPWVTNAELGTLNSNNLPAKRNFKEFSGLDAITGKGNFDIGEYISLILIESFQNHDGIFAFLIKNSVIKNLIFEQSRNKYKIGYCQKLTIDSKKEFDVSVNASLFFTNLNVTDNSFTCIEKNFYNKKPITTFGWYKNNFVNSINDYDLTSDIDGKSIFVWRSGVKHDCSKIMELEVCNGHFINSLKQEFELEEDLVFGLLKSSDLKIEKSANYRKVTIITQSRIGQDTEYIRDLYPLTYKYLEDNIEFFQRRKSSIYVGKPKFSIFGVGDYSFAPYKVAISGLYKTTHFTLVEPHLTKPVMLDDTCYFIGFDNLLFAQIAHCLLNSQITQRFLKSIIFSDEKRSINKDILMRLNFKKILEHNNYQDVKKILTNLRISDWEKFKFFIDEHSTIKQLSLF